MHSAASRVLTVKRSGMSACFLLAAAWLFGAIRFFAADASIRLTLPRLAAPPPGEYNLALYRWGPTIRASSYRRDPESYAPPGFLVDGQSRPSRLERWISASSDRTPWVEITWREPRGVSRVVLSHAAEQDLGVMPMRDYRLRCVPLWPGESAIEVHDNTSHSTTHPLRCVQATGLRIDWSARLPNDAAGAYEVEVWGQ